MSQYAPGAAGLLKPIESWLNDPEVSEILLNQPEEIWVEKGCCLTRYDVPGFHESHIGRLFQLIANENAQRISTANPLLSGSLHDGSRVQLCLPPTAKYHAMSIRRKVVKNFTLKDYQKNHFYTDAKAANIHDDSFDSLPESEQHLLLLFQSHEWDQFIKTAISLKKNIVISGGTSSGKTTFLNACLHHINHDDRIIILEDTREIEIPHQNQVQLLRANKMS